MKQQLKRLLESSNKNAGVDNAANNNVDVKKKEGVGKKGNGYKRSGNDSKNKRERNDILRRVHE